MYLWLQRALRLGNEIARILAPDDEEPASGSLGDAAPVFVVAVVVVVVLVEVEVEVIVVEEEVVVVVIVVVVLNIISRLRTHTNNSSVTKAHS